MATKKKAKSGRVYSSYDKKLQATPEEVRKRVARNKARRMMKRKLGAKAIKGKDINHIKPLSKGGKTSPGNLELMSPSKNRAKKYKSKKK